MTDVILTEVEDNSGMLAAINENFDKLETAINLSLSKAADAVNTLHTTLDANSQRLINLPAPVDGTDAARLVDITGTGVTVSLPSVTGHAGKFLGTDGNTALWTSFSTISIPTSQITGDLTGNAANVNGIVTVAHGGTGATTLTGYVKGAGTSALTASATIPGTDITGNIAGNAAGLSTTLAIGSGGTGQTTAANAINALVPSQTGNGGKYLSTNGSVVSWQSAPSGGGGGTVTDITAGAGLSGGLINISGTISITDTGVTAASYGAASKTLVATVNSRGQLTSLAETPIAILGSQVSGNITGNAAGLTSTLAIASGGTGATTAAAARTALGATTVGSNVFTAVDAAAARSAIGAGTGNGNGTVTSITQGTGLSFSSSPLTSTGTISIDSTVVTLTGTQTLTNKTITFPIISSISNTGTLTLPTTTDVLVGRITTDTLQNKTMSGSQNTFSNIPISALTGGPLSVALGGSGATTFTAGYLKASGTTAFTTVSTIPYTDISGTSSLVTLTGTQTLTNKTIAGTQITGNISGNAANVTGVVAVANGGTGISTPFYVDTIAAMVALTKASLVDGQVITVSGSVTRNDGGGGRFIWDSASTATVNTGTVFQAAAGGTGRWLRVSEGTHVDARWFGVTPDGVTRSTEAQAAYNYAKLSYSSLSFPAASGSPAYYALALNVSSTYAGILGSGIVATQFRPATTTGTVFTLNDTSGVAAPLHMRDFNITGQGSRQGIGIDHYSTGSASSGRLLLERAQFVNLDVSVNRPTGNFTEWYRDCFFSSSNYHFYNEDESFGHAGDITISGGEWRGANKACFYIDSTLGQSGKITIEDVTIQANDGYVLFVKNCNVTGVGVPAPVMRNCWNEGNALGGSITVGGVTGTPVWGYFQNCGMWVLDNSPPGPMTLINSTVKTINCDLTYAAPTTIDSTSVLTHDNARWINYANIPGLVNSIAHIESGASAAPFQGSWAQMPQFTGVAPANGATQQIRRDGSANITFTGTSTIVTTDQTVTAINGLTKVQRLTMGGAGNWEDNVNSGVGPIASGLYLALVFSGRAVSGSATFRFGLGTADVHTLYQTLSDTGFVTYKALVPLTAATAYVGFRVVTSAAATIDIAGYAAETFSSEALALEYLNSTSFPA